MATQPLRPNDFVSHIRRGSAQEEALRVLEGDAVAFGELSEVSSRAAVADLP
jgi:hypothetical protein